MAKKAAAKKVSKQAVGKKIASKPAGKGASKAGSKVVGKAAGKALAKPLKVNSGKGATPGELGAKLVETFNKDHKSEWILSVWDKQVRSIEGSGDLHVGPKAIMGKWAWWDSTSLVLGSAAEGPYVGATGFTVRFTMHVKDRASGNETRMSEVGVYTVKNGKIVQEEFMYGGHA